MGWRGATEAATCSVLAQRAAKNHLFPLFFFLKLMQSCLQVDLDTRLLNLYPNNKSYCTQPKLMY